MTRQKLIDYITSQKYFTPDSLVDLEVLLKKYPYFSIARILFLKNLQILRDEKYDKLVNKTAAYSTDRIRLKEILNRKDQTSPKTTKELIDKFIREEPTISKPDESKETNINIPEQDENKIFDIATETLAKVYLKQGNKSMAIKIYNQLILKYPEKSSYFAAQIKKIEKEN